MEVFFAGLAGTAQCLFFVAVAGIIVAAIVWGILKARERREAMARLAAELGFQYYPDDPWDLAARYAQFDLFGSGHSRRASNILAGKVDGRTALVFDYHYKTGSGKDEMTHSFQAAVLETPILAPRLSLRRESFLDTVASWVGHDDIDFESAEFSKRYYVKCEDRKFAYDLFHGRLIEYLLGCGDAPSMELGGPLLLLHHCPDGPEKVRRLLAIGGEIIRSIPDYVLHERGAAAKTGGPS
jgi:hypothetical protein